MSAAAPSGLDVARAPAHAVAGEPADADALLEPWFSCLTQRLPDVQIFDCHTHLGSDPDGSGQSPGELRDALDVVQARGVVFPLAQPHGYRAANDRVLAAAQASEGQLVAFCRVDPHDDAVGVEAQRALDRGAAGIKLHPRAEDFRLGDPAVRRLAALADERRVPIIVHAGRGIPSLGVDALDLAARHPHLPLILAHAAIVDLAWIWHEAAACPNLLFDTAWWNAADHLALLALIAPGQILFASDAPYGRPVATATIVLRAALATGLSREQISSIAGGQLERLLAGKPPRDVGPAPGAGAPAPGPLLERVHTLLIAAAVLLRTGGSAEEYVELARLACRLPDDHADAAVAASILELLDCYTRYRATLPGQGSRRLSGTHLIFVAAAIARTPEAPLPAPAPASERPAPALGGVA